MSDGDWASSEAANLPIWQIAGSLLVEFAGASSLGPERRNPLVQYNL
jgi:hypothetical protein